MSCQNHLILCLILSSTLLLACSPDKQQQTNTAVREEIKIIKNTNQSFHTNGIKIYKDPVTGQFLKSPPKQKNKLDKNIKNTANNNLTTQDKSTDVSSENNKISENSDGIRYIKIPSK